jgi:homogentisate 1,2-dioxygenase
MDSHKAKAKYSYQTGFGNELASEAIAGTLPQAQNTPQVCPKGLYAEQLSGAPFTAPRSVNRRSWLYRILPSARHSPFVKQDNGALYRGSFDSLEPNPERMRWNPLSFETIEGKLIDFSEGLITYCGAGSPSMKSGLAIHYYLCNTSMKEKAMYNSDGEMLIVPQVGTLDIRTEFGFLEVRSGEIVVIPRGCYFSVSVTERSRGYICEVYEGHFDLPYLGPIGANGLANPRDFEYPVASFEETSSNYTIINKFQSQLFHFSLDHSPFNVVAWHGNFAPFKYDLDKFCVVNTVLYDHADPSIFCVLTAQTAVPGTAVCDFVIFPPRWCVQERTFRPPYYHRNCMSEFMGLIKGAYDAKPEGFQPGGATLHSMMSAHGPDANAFNAASKANLVPVRFENTLAFMFESCYMLSLTPAGDKYVDKDYWKCWLTLESKFQTD